MDPQSLIGLLIGIAAIVLGQTLEGGHLSTIFQPTAAVIVFGGTLGATLLSVTRDDMRRGIRMFRSAFFPPPDEREKIAAQLTEYARLARKDGIIALEKELEDAADPFLASALRYVVDGMSSELLESVLNTELDTRHHHQLAGIQIYEVAGGYAPTIGIIGAVLGLIHVMENLGDPTQLGSGIAVSFVATIYGVGLANLVLIPIASRLHRIADTRQACDELIAESTLAIEAGHSPIMVQERLAAFLGNR